MNRAEMVDQIQRLLGDNPTTPVIWPDLDLNECIDLAVGLFSEVSPLKDRTILGIQIEVHKVDDDSNVIAAADATDQTSVNTLLNEIKSDYGTHLASTTYHRAADTTNTVAAADATNLATSLTLANELKADITAHMTQSGVHMVDDEQNQITMENAVDLTTVKALANKIKEKYTNHLDEETDGRTLYVNSVIGDSGFIRLEGVEYPVGKYPEAKPSFDYHSGNFLKVKSDYIPGDTGELVYVYWQKKHTFSDSASTIPIEHEHVLTLGAEGYALQLRAINQFHQAVTDLATGKTELAKMIAGGSVTLAEVATALGKVETHAATAVTALGKVDTYLAGATGSAKALLAQITTDVANLRTAVNTAVTACNAYLDEVDTTDLVGAEGVWVEEVKHILTQAGIPNAEDFLETGDGLINVVGVGLDPAGENRRYAETALGLARAWAQKRADFLTEAGERTRAAEGYAQEASQRLSNLRSYVEEASGWDAVADGFVDEAAQRINMARAFSEEALQRIAGLDVYGREAEGYRATATQLTETGKSFFEDGQSRLGLFFAKLKAIARDRKQLEKPQNFVMNLWVRGDFAGVGGWTKE